MAGDDSAFWDQRYRQEGAVWGDEPSPTAFRLALLLEHGLLSVPPPKGPRVLEVGFGYGRDLVYLGGQGCRLWGIEPSSQGRTMAEERLACQGIRPERLLPGRFEEADLPGETFDGFLSHRLIHLLLAQTTVTDFAVHIHRCLRPGGILALGARSRLDLNPADMVEVERGIYEYRHRPGHRIRYWDRPMFEAAFGAAFDVIALEDATEPECLARPVPCHLTILLARKK